MDKMFETERLIIRKLRDEDAQKLYENHLDDEVRKWFPNECYADAEEALDAARFFADCVDNGHLPFVLGVELKETKELIGDTGLSEVEGKPDETEIGYCIGQKYRGKGAEKQLYRNRQEGRDRTRHHHLQPHGQRRGRRHLRGRPDRDLYGERELHRDGGARRLLDHGEGRHHHRRGLVEGLRRD